MCKCFGTFESGPLKVYLMGLGLSIFHGVLWQRSVNPVKYLRRGNQPEREPDCRLMGPCSGGQSGTCGWGLGLVDGLLHPMRLSRYSVRRPCSWEPSKLAASNQPCFGCG